jgi:hypothetical protein
MIYLIMPILTELPQFMKKMKQEFVILVPIIWLWQFLTIGTEKEKLLDFMVSATFFLDQQS